MRFWKKNRFIEKSKRVFSAYMILTLLFEMGFPTVSMALTSGPSQPEVQSFEPVGTSQMVDPFSGDFTYNIPLLELDGYPVNISYHSGITMDQEASWTGLGWNINPGAINRNMRGIPDDFKGEHIVHEFKMKPNRTVGLSLGLGVEVFGGDLPAGTSVGLGSDFTVRFNNYTGVGIDRSITGFGSFASTSGPVKTSKTVGLGITSSSDNGLSIQPNVSFSAKIDDNQGKVGNMGLSVGTAWNSRAGLQHLTIGMNASMGLKTGRSSSNAGHNFSSSFSYGTQTYTPKLTLPYSNFTIHGSFKLGEECEGAYPYGKIAGFYSCQKLTQNILSLPAYGYLNADEGVKHNNALMDFNRENDAAYTTSTPALAIPNFTYDILSVSGQGIGGSYRPFRSDFGQVFDPEVSNTSSSISVGAELGFGTILKAGLDISVIDATSQSGRWDNSDGSNGAFATNYFTQSKSDPTYERFYYKEANEKSVDADPTFLQRAGQYDAQRYSLQQNSKFNTVATSNFASGGGAYGSRNAREKRNQNISMLTRGEMNKYALTVHDSLYSGAASYHTGEITSTTPDGRRYVYGIAAYNTRQEEASFAVGVDEFGSGGRLSDLNSNTGMIKYSSGDNSLNNSIGVDNFFSNTILPAYAHSYFLTAVLSADYVDSDTIRGPSPNDLGTYTKFNYKKTHSNFRWRTPYDSAQYHAAHYEGLKWTKEDDKASYVYGEKEIWYLNSIETKNYIAVFSLEDRKDGLGVYGKDGGRDASQTLKLLRKISLYTHANFDAHKGNSAIALLPIKEVHFDYDYSLCPHVPNNSGASEIVNGHNLDSLKGKLTLKQISFSYQNSSKGRLSPYKFVYGYNPSYNIKGYDRWGNYKPQDSNVTGVDGCKPEHNGLSNAEFPYVVQNKTNADLYSAAWCLDTVKLPSGGAINIDYESDDYGYVQNRQASQMYKILGLSSSKGSFTNNDTTSSNLLTDYLTIQLPTSVSDAATFYKQFISGQDFIYFRFMYEMFPGTYEYVPGYIPVSQINDYGIDGSGHGYIKFYPVDINESGGGSVCPITKTAIQYGRLNESKNVWQVSGTSTPASLAVSSTAVFGLQLIKSFIQSSFVVNIADAIQGPNKALYNPSGLHRCCSKFIKSKSWIRLNNPNMHKLGGGCRVKKISISDEWSDMTNGAMSQFSYGQEYSYNNEDGTSSGVASYEPQLGGEENSLRTPKFFDFNKLFAPDDHHYVEEPFGESFFPSPTVGYGRVTVQNIKYSGVTKHATGKIVHEFWTAKDFPTIAVHSGLEAIREKTDPLSISSFLNVGVKDYLTASQGFYVETNDMHGKPKGQKVYQENISTPISSIEYDYKKTPYGNGSYTLDNTVQVINPNGSVSSKSVGTFFDFVTDFRQSSSSTIGGSANLNVDIIFAVITIVVPSVWPGYSNEQTRFRSTASTKVSHRFGLLEKVIAKDLGSVVETDNMAYDSETGEVILTKTTTDYNDQIYTLNYPAYWYYDGMGPAYKNIGISMGSVSFTSGKATISNASNYFTPGDEIEMGNSFKAWVLSVTGNVIKVEKKDGSTPSGSYDIKIIRSGRRNMQSDNMASIVTLQNPLTGVGNNVYQQVLKASGVEYNDQWSIFCDCIGAYGGSDPSASYVTGAKGNWRQKRSFAYLTGRTQSNYDNNTNTRKDGVYTSYNPLYKNIGAKWQLDTTNWTFTSKVTIVNPNGQDLENQDALGRYSAATYGYNQTFATAVSANARYKEIGFDNAEDYNLNNCADKHFKFMAPAIDSTQSHTGRKSIRVSVSSPVEMLQTLATLDCSTTPPCQINITKGLTVISVAVATIPNYTFSGPGADAPINITWVITSGSPIISLIPGGIDVSATGNWSAIVTVTGASGCSQKFYLPGNY